MTKQEKTALNMAKFIQGQTLLLLEKLNELNLDEMANQCERLHELSEQFHDDLRKEIGREEQEELSDSAKGKCSALTLPRVDRLR